MTAPPAAPSALSPSDPPTVGPYRLVGRLGQGGMGVVYLAHGQDGTPVAVKVVKSEVADQPQFRARFAREVQAARAVDGQYTARVVDADTDASPQWVATQYVPGPTLADHIDTHGPMPADQVRLLGLGLAEAIDAIHAAGLIHRDLKPSNIILSPEGPKVIDFGISQTSDATSLTQTGVYLGSLAWMSPEQVTGTPLTPASDMFSLGLLLAYAALGHHPYGDGRPEAVAFRTINHTPNLTGLPQSIRTVCQSLLVVDTTKRPSPTGTVAALTGERTTINDITRLMATSWDATPTTAAPKTTDAAPSMSRRRRATLIGALAGIGSLAVAAGVAVALGVSPTSSLAQESSEVAASSGDLTLAADDAPENRADQAESAPTAGDAPVAAASEPQAAAKVAECMAAHDMDFPTVRTLVPRDDYDLSQAGSLISTTTYQECLWPAPDWAAPDGYNVITIDRRVGDPGAPLAVNTSDVDVITARCPVVRAEYDFVKFGDQEPQPALLLSEGDAIHADGTPHDGQLPFYLDADQRMVFAANHRQQTVDCTDDISTRAPMSQRPTSAASFPGPADLGDTGDVVLQWQAALISAGVISNIPENLDGVFGPGMEAAIREYQEEWGLTVDGVAGFKTWNHIISTRAPMSQRPTSAASFPGPADLGDTGDVVLQWQAALISAGVISNIPENLDGVFGPGMEAAIREYQEEWGLTVDGVAGFKTWNHMAQVL